MHSLESDESAQNTIATCMRTSESSK